MCFGVIINHASFLIFPFINIVTIQGLLTSVKALLLCRDKSYAYSLATIKDPIFGDAEIMMRAQLSPQLEMKCPEWVLGTSNYPTLNGLKP